MDAMMRSLALAAAMCVLLSATGHCFTASQERVLRIAFEQGKRHLDDPELVQAIAHQETMCGFLKDRKNLHSDSEDIRDRYFGVMQLKLAAYEDVNRYFRLGLDHTDEEAAKLLQENDEFNVYVGALYLRFLYEYFDGDVARTILAYNVGLGTVNRRGLSFDPYGYLDKVKRHANGEMVRFNAAHGLYSGRS
jgi:soluble lytic murein transglycosylase-like protein